MRPALSAVLLLALLEIKTETVLVGLELDALATAQHTSKTLLVGGLRDVRKGESRELGRQGSVQHTVQPVLLTHDFERTSLPILIALGVCETRGSIDFGK
jgi:hypothetical protein